jgi:hypothetical protein
MNNLSQDSRCPARDLREYVSNISLRALPLHEPAQSRNFLGRTSLENEQEGNYCDIE